MRRYREMRAAEKEKKRQKRLEAIRAVIKKRQDQMLIDDVLNKSASPSKRKEDDNSNFDGEDRDLRSPKSPSPRSIKKTQDWKGMSPVSPRSPRGTDKKKKGVNFEIVHDDR